MRKMLQFSALLLATGLILGLTGCPVEDDGGKEKGDDFAKYYDGNFRNNRNGSTEVVNNTGHDMLLFEGEHISTNYIVGGVKQGTRANLNFSTENDWQVGGYKLLRAVKESEFKKAKDKSIVDHSAMITYGAGRRFTVDITSTTDGDYQYTVYNRSRDYGLELRENSPEGRKVAYLTKGEVRRIIKSPNSTELTLYPVWVAFNTQTKSIVTFTPTDTLSALDIQPKRPNEEDAPYYFPMGGTNAIQFPDPKLPFATIVIRNNGSLVANFRNALTIRRAESNYTGITSGSTESYEIQSAGGTFDLNLAMSQQQTVVKVRFEDDPAAAGVAIQNGRYYSVTLIQTGSDPANPDHYTAWLVDEGPISTSQLLISN